MPGKQKRSTFYTNANSIQFYSKTEPNTKESVAILSKHNIHERQQGSHSNPVPSEKRKKARKVQCPIPSLSLRTSESVLFKNSCQLTAHAVRGPHKQPPLSTRGSYARRVLGVTRRRTSSHTLSLSLQTWLYLYCTPQRCWTRARHRGWESRARRRWLRAPERS